MISNAIEIQGTLREDGTLVLDHKPDLPPGRVKVIVQAIPDYTQTDIWQFFERLWAEQRARGHIPRSKEEIDADLEAARQEDEERRQRMARFAKKRFQEVLAWDLTEATLVRTYEELLNGSDFIVPESRVGTHRYSGDPVVVAGKVA